MVVFTNSNLIQGGEAFNELLKTNFIENILLKKLLEFDSEYTSVSKEILSGLVFEHKDSFSPVVKTHRPWNPWSRAYATTYTGNYDLIKLNSRRLNRSWQSIAGSICHEWGHCLEYFIREIFPQFFFNHGGPGDNSPVVKENTFQYWLGVQVKLELNKYNTFDEFLSEVHALN